MANLQATTIQITHGGLRPDVVETLAIVPSPKQLPVPISSHFVQTRLVGHAEAFTSTRVYKGNRTDWAIINLAQDLLFYSNGRKLIMLEVVLSDITRTLRVGINFDAVFIAQEMYSLTVINIKLFFSVIVLVLYRIQVLAYLLFLFCVALETILYQ
jgi:hypothetical protein